MKKLCVLLLLGFSVTPVLASESGISNATAEETATATPKPTPIPRTAIVVSYAGHDISAGLLQTMNYRELEDLWKEPKGVQEETLRQLVENTLFRILIAEQAKQAGVDKQPKVSQWLRLQRASWLSRYFIAVTAHKDYKKTDEDYKAYYQAHLDNYRERERFQFRHIFFQTIEKPPEKQKEALQRAREALAEIKAGTDFVKVAEKYSDSTKKGSVVGPFYVNKNDPGRKVRKDIQDAVLALEPGQVSDIVRTKYGYEIFRLEKYVPPKPKPFQQVRKNIDDTLRRKFVDDLKAKVLQECFDEAVTDWNPQVLEDSSVEDTALICRVYGEPVTVGFYRSLFKGGMASFRRKELKEKGRDAFIRDRLVFMMISAKKAVDKGLDRRLPSVERLKVNEIEWLFKNYMPQIWRKHEKEHPITEEIIQKCYKERKKRLLGPTRAEVAEIFRALPPFDKSVRYEQFKAEQATQKPLLEALKRIQAGEPFADVAKEVSEATTAADGGRIGILSSRDKWRGRVFISEMLRLKDGETSNKPVKVDGGYALVHVIKKFPPEPLPLNEARPQVERIVSAQMKRKFKDDLFKKLVKWDDVKIDQEILSRIPAPRGVAPEKFFEE